MKNLKIVLLAVAAAAALVFQVAAGDWNKIRIATEGAYPPWNTIDESGKLVGFEIDLAKELCRRMNVECEVVTQKWRSIIKGLNGGKYDAIMAAMSITEDRRKLVNFSRNYASTPNVAPIIALTPVASPSIPSVKFAAFDTAVTTRITRGIKTIQANFSALSPTNGTSLA